jgi:hypothetical protein
MRYQSTAETLGDLRPLAVSGYRRTVGVDGLCRLCGCATARSLRPLLAELIGKGKLKVVDGHLINRRAMEEIDKFERRKAISSEGGKARSARVRAEFGSNSTGIQAETRPDIEGNQQDSLRPPSPSPSQYKIPLSEGAEAAPCHSGC